jgi:hypothetical protein
LVLPAGEAARSRELAAPPDGLARKRLDQEPAQCAPVDLGPGRAPGAGLVEQHVAMPVDDALRVLTREREGEERVMEARGPEPELTAVSWMSIKPPCTRASGEASAS